MPDYGVKYTGTTVPDSGLTFIPISNLQTASGDDHTMHNTLLKRVAVEAVCDGSANAYIKLFVQPKIGINYAAKENAYHFFTVKCVANQTMYEEFILQASNAPKDFIFNIENVSGGQVTVTIETEDAVSGTVV